MSLSFSFALLSICYFDQKLLSILNLFFEQHVMLHHLQNIIFFIAHLLTGVNYTNTSKKKKTTVATIINNI